MITRTNYSVVKEIVSQVLKGIEIKKEMPGGWGFHGKESACNAGHLGLIPGLRRSPVEGIGHPLQYSWASWVAQTVKNPPAMQEAWVLSLGWENPLEEVMATHSGILAWRIPWTEEPGGLQSTGSQRVGHAWATQPKTAQHQEAEGKCYFLIAKLCLTLCDPVGCSQPISPVNGIFQARILEWVAMLSSKGSSWPRDGTQVSCVSCTAGGFFTTDPWGKQG